MAPSGVSGVDKSILTDDQEKPLGRSEEYLVLKVIERIGSPKEFLKHYDEFYSLEPTEMAHLFAYEMVRDAEDRVLSSRGF